MIKFELKNQPYILMFDVNAKKIFQIISKDLLLEGDLLSVDITNILSTINQSITQEKNSNNYNDENNNQTQLKELNDEEKQNQEQEISLKQTCYPLIQLIKQAIIDNQSIVYKKI